MYRLSNNNNTLYRDYAWALAEAIYEHCRADDGSYYAVMDVNQIPTKKHKYPSPYFVGATLKYLYLIFCDNSLLSLDQWLFNEIGQPLPISQNSVSQKTIFNRCSAIFDSFVKSK